MSGFFHAFIHCLNIDGLLKIENICSPLKIEQDLFCALIFVSVEWWILKHEWLMMHKERDPFMRMWQMFIYVFLHNEGLQNVHLFVYIACNLPPWSWWDGTILYLCFTEISIEDNRTQFPHFTFPSRSTHRQREWKAFYALLGWIFM